MSIPALQSPASELVVHGDEVVVPFWGQPSEGELRTVAEALVSLARDRRDKRRSSASRVETRLRAVVAEAMSDLQVVRLDGPDWTVVFMPCRLMGTGPDADGGDSFVILSEQTVRVILR
jgi:hypothetical protein